MYAKSWFFIWENSLSDSPHRERDEKQRIPLLRGWLTFILYVYK